MSLTAVQTSAIETAGREVAEGWLRQGDLETPDADYSFDAEGDWQHVRAAAIAAGVDWEPRAAQPASEVYADVWDAAGRGYRAALDAESSDAERLAEVPPEIGLLLCSGEILEVLEQRDPRAEADARFKAASRHLRGRRRGFELLRAWLGGVDFGEPCGVCGAAGLHQDRCPEIG